MAEQQSKKCTSCKKSKSIELFKMKKNGDYLKTCTPCREMSKANKQRNKCEHGRQRASCIDCDGVGICVHKRVRCQCIACGGTSICVHKRRRSECIACGGNSVCKHKKQLTSCKQCSDPVKVTIKHMIISSRQSDKKYKRFDPVKFIDTDFIQGLLDDYKNCYWCKVKMQCITYCKTLTTIERLNNKLGHNKDNCVLACLSCNAKKISNK